MPVIEVLRRHRELEADVLRRTDVLQHARVARGVGQRAWQEQVVRVLAIRVDRAGDALVEHAEVETDIELVGRLPF